MRWPLTDISRTPRGESDWIMIDPEIDFAAWASSFDTMLLGRKTYEAARRQGGGIPLLPDPAERAKLKLTKHRVYARTGTVALEYKVA